MSYYEFSTYDDIFYPYYPTVFLGEYTIPNGMYPRIINARFPIEWYVLELDRSNKRALLLSRYSLDWCAFSKRFVIGDWEVTWENSYLKKWLNTEFLEGFSKEAIKRIVDVRPEKVFLLSVEEYNKYLKGRNEAACTGFFNYPDRDGENESDWSNSRCDLLKQPWWLRTVLPEDASNVYIVEVDGQLDYTGSGNDEVGIRPALWISCQLLGD